jgi:hypothetical protein
VYEISVTDEFAGWFEALEAADAELVATALEVVAATGPAFDPIQQSQSLLWFDGTCGSALDETLVAALTRWPQPAYTELMQWHREVVRCLDAPAFARALNALDGASAAGAVAAVRRCRHSLRTAWLQLAQLGSEHRGFSAEAAGRASVSVRPLSEAVGAVKAALEAALGLVGLEVEGFVDRESGLREFTLANAQPRLRVIYGLDVAGQRLVALVGDALTRSYYGDSVRLAERLWRDHFVRDALQQGLRPRP